MIITFTSSKVKFINPRVEVNMMVGDKPKTFREVMKLIYKDSNYEIYQVDENVYLIHVNTPHAVVVYNFTKNIIYYSFSVSGWGVSQLAEKLDWSKIREIIQSIRS